MAGQLIQSDETKNSELERKSHCTFIRSIVISNIFLLYILDPTGQSMKDLGQSKWSHDRAEEQEENSVRVDVEGDPLGREEAEPGTTKEEEEEGLGL